MFAERITSVNGVLLAILIRAQPHQPARGKEPWLHFFSQEQDQLQLAAMTRPVGEKIASHWHKPYERKVYGTPEHVFVQRGRLKVTFYNGDETACATRVLEAGDHIVLLAGGHGFEVLEEVEMWETKQGPYLGKDDKVVFTPKEVPEREKGEDYEW